MDTNQMLMSSIKISIYDFLKENESYSLFDLLSSLECILQSKLDALDVNINLEENFGVEESIIDNQLYLPLYYKGEYIGSVIVLFKNDVTYSTSFLNELSSDLAILIYKCKERDYSSKKEKRYEQLYSVTSLFHSSMEMESVLAEIFKTLREMYKDFSYYLLLTSDNENLQHLPVKNLEMDTANDTAWQAYVTGTVQMEDSVLERRSIVYIPLKGKQGVYGVLQIICLDSMIFPKEELNFLILLANTAGTAFENAQLYQQSRQLVADLRLINETSHRLNSNLRLTEVTNYMKENIKTSFDAKEVGFCSFQRRDINAVNVLEGSSEFFYNDVPTSFLQYIRNYVIQSNEPLFIGDIRINEHINVDHYCSCMIIPMDLTNGKLGACIVLHPLPYFFSFDQFKLLQSLIHHSTLAFSNSILREELEKHVITDYLTKLYSRRYLDNKIKLSMKHDSFGTFILLDIDDFKQVNDLHGHQVGDEILVQVGSIIMDNIRDTDVGARWGGEELAIYLPKVDLTLGQQIADRIKHRVNEQTSPTVTVSCGVSFWEKEMNDNARDLFSRADIALYKAKGKGKNQVYVG